MGIANENSIAWGCARRMHANGASLVLSCLNEKAANFAAPLAREINAPLLESNLNDPGALEQLVDSAAARLDGLDFAVHSIAWAPLEELHGRVADTSGDGFMDAMRISCHSFVRLAALCEPHMRARGGTLMTMSFVGASQAVPNYGLMGPVKAALESTVRYLAMELGPAAIRVHALSPGPVPTRAASGIKGFGEMVQKAREQAPLRRLVSLDEIGNVAAFLASPGATGMTGQTIFVDGGMHAVR